MRVGYRFLDCIQDPNSFDMTGPKAKRRQRVPDAPAIVLLPPGEQADSLHRQVYAAIRDAILAGRLASGARIPSSRALAADLGVARNTVTLAFDQLRAEGFIAGRRGGGTRVSDSPPDQPAAPTRRLRARPRRAVASVTPSPPVVLPARGAAVVAAGRAAGVPTPARAFQLGVPALDIFPAAEWTRLAARRWRRGHAHLGEGSPNGDPELRAAIVAHVGNTRGVRCSADQVFIVNGAAQAIDLVSRILLGPGDEVWMEDPGYLHARTAVRDAGACIVPVPVDSEGLSVADGVRLAPQARLAYVTPSHQFPLGHVMSAPRRLALLSWARAVHAWILEDDYDSEFRYSGRPLPSLQGLDVECNQGAPACVLYVGTFSKTMAPGFRLAYLIVPDALIEVFRAARNALDRYASTIEQGVLAEFIAEGHYARHVRRARALYAERQQVLLDASREILGDRLALVPDVAGMHLVGCLDDDVSDERVTAAASAAGVDVSPLSRYRMQPQAVTRGALLLNYAGFDGPAIVAGVQRLGTVLRAATCSPPAAPDARARSGR